jgi:hypothetical protein
VSLSTEPSFIALTSEDVILSLLTEIKIDVGSADVTLRRTTKPCAEGTGLDLSC